MSGLRSNVTVSTDHGRGYCPIKGKNVPSRVGERGAERVRERGGEVREQEREKKSDLKEK